MKISQLDMPVTFASLRITGDELALPDMCSTYFGVMPELAYRMSEPFVSTQGKHRERKFSLWIYSTEKTIFSSNTQEHMRLISLLLKGREDFIRLFIEGMKAELLVSIFWHGQINDHFPYVDDAFDLMVERCGGKVERDFARDCLDDASEAA